MAALGSLIIPTIFLLFGLAAIGSLAMTFRTKNSSKLLTVALSALFCFLIFSFKSCLNEAYRKDQLDQVGVYYLTNYQNCNKCILELKEDMTYEVVSDGIVIEKSNWHYESGGDYWITYLNDDKYQLGYGKYSITQTKRKYSGSRLKK